jgi:hypothetical protein
LHHLSAIAKMKKELQPRVGLNAPEEHGRLRVNEVQHRAGLF